VLRTGMRVYHTQAPYRGLGRVVAIRRGARRVLVKWDVGSCTEHDLAVIRKPGA
jgi:hypothetical protein